MKKLIGNLLTSLLSILILLVVMEICVRIFVDKSYYKFAKATNDWEQDDTIGWRHKSNYSDHQLIHGRMIDFATNEDGLRPAALKREKQPGVKRVLLVGNSTVNGRAVQEYETLHYFLDSLLNATGDNYEIINAGVDCYSTDQSYLTIKKLLPLYKPDIVAYGLCVNDLYFNGVDEFQEISKPLFFFGKDTLLLHVPGKKAGSQWSDKSLTIKGAVQYSALYGLLRPSIQKARVMVSKQGKLEMGGDMLLYKDLTMKDSLFYKMSELIGAMNADCKKADVDFLLYTHPEVEAVWQPYREAMCATNVDPYTVEKKLQEITVLKSVDFVGMVKYFIDNAQRGPFHLLPKDPHCNGKGYLLQAEVLASEIREDKRPDMKNIANTPALGNVKSNDEISTKEAEKSLHKK